ncbi:hypothetical protein D3C84_414430 [compost metagenome]
MAASSGTRRPELPSPPDVQGGVRTVGLDHPHILAGTQVVKRRSGGDVDHPWGSFPLAGLRLDVVVWHLPLDEEGERGADAGRHPFGFLHGFQIGQAGDHPMEQRHAAQLMNPLAQGQVVDLGGIDLLVAIAEPLQLTGVIEHHKVRLWAPPAI